MDGINIRFLIVQAISLAVFLGWIVLSILALFSLRKRTKLHATAHVLWVILIVCVPILGAIAYWIVRPNADQAVG